MRPPKRARERVEWLAPIVWFGAAGLLYHLIDATWVTVYKLPDVGPGSPWESVAVIGLLVAANLMIVGVVSWLTRGSREPRKRKLPLSHRRHLVGEPEAPKALPEPTDLADPILEAAERQPVRESAAEDP